MLEFINFVFLGRICKSLFCNRGKCVYFRMIVLGGFGICSYGCNMWCSFFSDIELLCSLVFVSFISFVDFNIVI